ncbi:hypothetical protein JCM33374_g2067 [Metschnikowia sp. JCM 33374]|nr:hypothetical protein JCM33374_g2067 [Metschnikowia sp. JCM 33374]
MTLQLITSDDIHSPEIENDGDLPQSKSLSREKDYISLFTDRSRSDVRREVDFLKYANRESGTEPEPFNLPSTNDHTINLHPLLGFTKRTGPRISFVTETPCHRVRNILQDDYKTPLKYLGDEKDEPFGVDFELIPGDASEYDQYPSLDGTAYEIVSQGWDKDLVSEWLDMDDEGQTGCLFNLDDFQVTSIIETVDLQEKGSSPSSLSAIHRSMKSRKSPLSSEDQVQLGSQVGTSIADMGRAEPLVDKHDLSIPSKMCAEIRRSQNKQPPKSLFGLSAKYKVAKPAHPNAPRGITRP